MVKKPDTPRVTVGGLRTRELSGFDNIVGNDFGQRSLAQPRRPGTAQVQSHLLRQLTCNS